MTKQLQRLGRRGEALAKSHLSSLGYSILHTNYRTASGEIDLVTQKDGTMVFVEVRTKSGGEFGSPEESITSTKRARLVLAVEEYLQTQNADHSNWRIDVVAVELRHGSGPTRVEVIENAVEL